MHPDAVDAGELRLQHCHDCGLVNFPPRVRCPDCFAEMTWAPASGEGTVYSVGVVHRPNQPAAFEERLPVVLAVVELAEGPRLVSNVLADPDEVRVGAAVRVVFETVAAETVLPLFELVD
ncbi:MAG: Zn-ribbon domain-containing OB-fold protein [Haloferacaceae archaeon]